MPHAALCRKAAKRLKAGDAKAAIECLEHTFTYPENLGEGKLYGAQENLQNYLLGEAYRLLGEKAKAEACYKKASAGLSVPQSAVYYNDQPPESIFCQGLALRRLGAEEQARAVSKPYGFRRRARARRGADRLFRRVPARFSGL